jgi:hypothetical protein
MTLGAATSVAFFTFAEAGVPDGAVVSYVIEDGTNVELGIGTYTASGTTLSRDTVTASKISGTAGTTKLTLSGSAVVYITALAADIVPYTNGAANVPSTTASTSTTTGALTVAGGVGVAGALYMGGTLDVSSFVSSRGSSSSYFFEDRTTGAFAAWTLYADSGAARLYSYTSAADLFVLTGTKLALPQTTASTSTTTGALTVAGGVGVAGDINAGGSVVGSHVQNLVQGVDIVVPASSAMYAPDYYEIAAGKALEIGVDAVMEIG